jgi:peptidyl-prolyl cis-trans isomerase D
MFDFVAKHKRLIMITLLLLILPPFALFGIEHYFTGRESDQVVARVGNYAISQEEFSRALRDQQRNMQRAAQGRIDPAMLDSPQMRQSTLEMLVQRRLLLERAERAGLAVSEQALDQFMSRFPPFLGEDGKYSEALADQYVKSEGLTGKGFRARVRQEMLLQQYSSGYGRSEFASRTVVDRVARLAEQQREVSQHTIEPEQFLAKVKLDPGAAKQYYEANQQEFRTPEQARVEYVALSGEALAQQAQVDPAEVKKYYEANHNQFGNPETRQVSHILIAAGSDAAPEARQKAKAKAEEIYKELQKNPSGFAEVARKQSQDTGSAARGGDLGRISRGTMKDVPEFEEAAFKLKTGEISQPVETRHGYHIIRVVDVRPAQVKPFEEVRAQVEGDLKRQSAAKRYAELAEKFTNDVYEQSESLKPAADLVKAPVKTSGWITRGHADEPLLNNQRLLTAIFAEDTLKNKRNTEAIEVTPGTMVAARLAEYKPAAVQPFAEVSGAIEKRLSLLEATKLAAAEGRRLLDELKQGKTVQVAWSQPVTVTRADRKSLPDPVIRQVYRMDVSKLPAYAGVETLTGAYYLLRLSKVQDADKVTPEKLQTMTDEMRQVIAQETLAAYIAGLRQKTGVTVNKDALEKKDRQQ